MLENFSWFILVPVWISILIMGARFLDLPFSKRNIVLLSVFSTLFSAIYCGIGLFYTFNNSPVEIMFNFLSIGEFNLQLGIYVDMLNTLTGLAVSVITFVIYVYSVFYMNNEKNFSRFYSLMNLFNSTILAFIFSPNMFQMLIFWEVVGAVSYLLIRFWYDKPKISCDAKRVFLVNVIGDICLFIGFISISAFVIAVTGDNSLASLPFSNLNLIVTSLWAATSPFFYTAISILLLIAALVKSAQFPINSWLINAMSAPTPVSALIHSSTLVMMGVFLLMRIFPIAASNLITVKLMISLGVITAVITSISALFQTNIKKILAYSTSAQLGLVMIALGCYNPVAGIVYLISHAFIKALLFMCAGIVIKTVNNKNILFMGGFRNNIPAAAICFIVGAVALSGLGFSGFSAKSLLSVSFCTSPAPSLLFGFVGMLTTLYIFRLYFIVFENKPAYNAEEINNTINTKLYKLAYFAIIFMSLVVILMTFVLPKGHASLMYLFNILMIIAAYFLYNNSLRFKKCQLLYNIAANGFYINKFYYWAEVIFYKYFSACLNFIEIYIFGGIEYLIKNTLLSLSNGLHKIQLNNFQIYITYGIWILIFLMCVFISIYLFILNLFGV